MEAIITITLGLIISYLLFRFMRKQKNVADVYSDIIANDKYKAKGQWER
ncbi:hypothetical protein GOV09_00725 [Candidatus Woesearchaeota archaeon]|nr:hypothetical protein [Candidatus Woesearchaeota archaeon]